MSNDTAAAREAARQSDGKFGEQAKSDPGQLDLSFEPTDQRQFRHSDRRVQGSAEVGQFVVYSDIANQGRNVEEVIGVGKQKVPVHDGRHVAFIDGDKNEYRLRDTATGAVRTDTLNQYGWTFCTKEDQ